MGQSRVLRMVGGESAIFCLQSYHNIYYHYYAQFLFGATTLIFLIYTALCFKQSNQLTLTNPIG